MPPPPPKLQKMNTSIDQFTFNKVCREDPSPAVSSLHHYPPTPNYRFNRGKKKLSRNEYLKTLEE